jgi:hypothetical protein
VLEQVRVQLPSQGAAYKTERFCEHAGTWRIEGALQKKHIHIIVFGFLFWFLACLLPGTIAKQSLSQRG